MNITPSHLASTSNTDTHFFSYFGTHRVLSALRSKMLHADHAVRLGAAGSNPRIQDDKSDRRTLPRLSILEDIMNQSPPLCPLHHCTSHERQLGSHQTMASKEIVLFDIPTKEPRTPWSYNPFKSTTRPRPPSSNHTGSADILLCSASSFELQGNTIQNRMGQPIHFCLCTAWD